MMMPPVVSIEGEVGTGKTSLALTFPKPIVHMDTDVGGFSRASWRFTEELKSNAIRSQSYHVPQQAIIDKLRLTASKASKITGVKDLWYKMLEDYLKALVDPGVRTIVWDSWTRVWTLCTNAFLEEKQQKDENRVRLLEIEYTEPNLRMVSLVDAAREAGKGLVLVCHLTDERRDVPTTEGIKSMTTGKRIADQWRRTGQLVDMIIRTELNSNKPKATITQSKLVLDLTGMVYGEPDWNMIETAVKMLRGEPND